MKGTLLRDAGIFFFIIGLAACSNSSSSKAGDTVVISPGSTLRPEVVKLGQVSIFDGKSLEGWHGFNKTGKIRNWKVEDSALVCLGSSKSAAGGDIVSDKEYENFELSWQWKVTKGGNSGMMYHVIESPKYKTTYETGPEYQMIDDIGFPEKLQEWQKSGADYAMNPAIPNKKLAPVGEWNTSKIVFNRGHVEHWLNGEKIVDFEAWNDKWTKAKKMGKWQDFPDYGTATKGHLALQDNGHKVYFKNIMMTDL